MNNTLIEQIVERVLQQLKPRVLVVVSPAKAYEQAVFQRLSQLSSVSFSVYMTAAVSDCSSINSWAGLGSVYHFDSFNVQQLAGYQGIFIPFLDANVVGEVANGLFTSEESKLILPALSQNIPVRALKNHCCPESELNKILGLNKNRQYNELIKANINKVIKLGIDFISPDNIDEMILPKPLDNNVKVNDINPHRYITLSEVMKKPDEYGLQTHKLTDSALDYLKSKK